MNLRGVKREMNRITHERRIGEVLQAVAREKGLPVEKIVAARFLGGARAYYARNEAMRRMRAAGVTLPFIARAFRMHHTNVLHHLRGAA